MIEVTEHPSRAARGLEQLEHQAAHARRRYDLHKQKVYAGKLADPVRLRELKRERDSAQSRLSRAEGAVRAAEKDDTHEQEVLADSARIEEELKRDPNRADTKVARAARSPFTRVREVRERLGLYFTRDD